MSLRKATTADFEEVEGLLIACNLPSDDIAKHFGNFIVHEEEGVIIGVGGLEVHGTDGLVRSIAVKPASQGKGIGKSLYNSIENRAFELGIDALYMLTESAEVYFSQFGFIVIERKGIPNSIKNTKQFSLLCPSSATVMFKALTTP
jgi:amino-acid N-acetyltransferase